MSGPTRRVATTEVFGGQLLRPDGRGRPVERYVVHRVAFIARILRVRATHCFPSQTMLMLRGRACWAHRASVGTYLVLGRTPN
jgi:hypothetical protein